MGKYTVVGQSIIRKDALEKVTGKALYAPDIHPNGMLYGRILGSPHAHARILHIDTSEAENYPGVKAVITGKDVPDQRTGYIEDRHILCKEKVRYVGDPVAAVAAVSEEAAEKALRLIKVEYEELPAVIDPLEAYDEKCGVVIHEDLKNYGAKQIINLYYHQEEKHPNVFIHRKIRHGNTEEAFKKADYIYEGTYKVPRAHQCALEPHACVVEPELDGGLTIWASEQGGVRLKYFICSLFGIETSKVRFITPYLGGGFGGKVDLMVTPIAVVLARKAGRPVKLEMSREEVFLHGNPRSPAVVKIRDGIMKDGTVIARQIEQFVDGGAYNGHATIMVSESSYGAIGTYRTPNLTLDGYGIYTNTPGAGPYRGLGSEILVFAIECQLDRMAEKLGIDKVEIRKKNLLVDGDEDALGQITYNNTSMDALQKAAEFIEWNKPLEQEPGPWKIGRGISVGNKFTTTGAGSTVICKVHDDGTIELRHFQVEMGQGCNTILAMIAAEFFKTSPEKIKIVFDDSALCPYDMGTYCSRGTFVNGNAVLLACEDAKKQVLKRASEVMGVEAEYLDTENGEVYEVAHPVNRIPYKKLYNEGGWLPRGAEIIGKDTYFHETGVCDPETGQGEAVCYYSYGAISIELAINQETGDFKILKVGGWYDMGQPLNKKLCEIQIEGAMVMGIGQACLEEMLFNDQGVCINPNFRDYKFPTMLDTPFNDETGIGFTGRPHKLGPYGAKGMGEVALVPVMPAVANAISNALGIQLNEIPLTKEKIYWAIQEKKYGR